MPASSPTWRGLFAPALMLVLATSSWAQSPHKNVRVAVNSGGTMYSAWERSGYMITPEVRYQSGGVTGGTAVSLYSGSSTPGTPDIDVDDADNFVVVWAAMYSGTPRICMSINGGSALQVGIQTSGTWEYGRWPRVTISRDGDHIAVAWLADSSSSSIRAQCFDNSGAPLSEPFRVNDADPTPNNYFLGDISSGDDGDFVVSYNRHQASALGRGIFAKGFLAPSAYVTTPTVNFTELAVALSASGAYHYTLYPEVACYHDGSFVVIYNEGYSRITASRYSNAGTAVTSTDITIPTEQFSTQYADWTISVACERDEPGNYVVTWGTAYDPNPSDNFNNNIAATEVVSDIRQHSGPFLLIDGIGSYPTGMIDTYNRPSVGMDDDGVYDVGFEFEGALLLIWDAL